MLLLIDFRKQLKSMIMKKITSYIIALPIICSMFIAIVFIAVGFYYTYLGTHGILSGELATGSHPGFLLLESLDMFLISFLFYIFSLGFSHLFLPKSKLESALGKITPQWLLVKNFAQLKMILWETVLTTLVILFIGDILKNESGLGWNNTIIPIGIMLLSASTFLIRRGESRHHKSSEK